MKEVVSRERCGLQQQWKVFPIYSNTVACKLVCGFILGRNNDFKPDQQQKENPVCPGMWSV